MTLLYSSRRPILANLHRRVRDRLARFRRRDPQREAVGRQGVRAPLFSFAQLTSLTLFCQQHFLPIPLRTRLLHLPTRHCRARLRLHLCLLHSSASLRRCVRMVYLGYALPSILLYLTITNALFAFAAAVNFLGGTRLEKDRALLATYPLCLLFFLLAWMTLLV